ncbi:PQQ-dependent sugar dehydrogenase [Bdellovibrio sp. HCB274]|uniref:PQQ-dependent sugar dehydrogenase n=1 Tax=Bdellovibrio sp. HCB274 TaxID=3394361 RepID=UPI0039B3D9E4
MFKRQSFWISVLCLGMIASAQAKEKLPIEKLKMPPGFEISVWATVPNARSIAQAPGGRFFVGNRSEDNVYLVQNGKAQIFAEKLNTPNGVAFKDGKLYVSQIADILEFNVPANVTGPQKPVRTLTQKFPKDTHHGWKFIRFGPDGKLYVPVGAPCNICDMGTEYGRIYRIDVNGTSKEIVAEGVRNTVGFDWDPVSKDLWFTDNGRDWMGDDLPPDEINHLTTVGQHFGFPFCHGKNILDKEFGKGKDCKDYTPPEAELRAHVAALGMRFYNGKMFPSEYQGGIIYAERGSWNRSVPQGYMVGFAFVKDGKITSVKPLVEGWLQVGDAWGRPVDVEVMEDGSVLISDDKAGVIYRLSYKAKKGK